VLYRVNAEHAAEREHLSTGFEAQVLALAEDPPVSRPALTAAEGAGERARGAPAAAREAGGRARAAVIQRALDAEVIHCYLKSTEVPLLL